MLLMGVLIWWISFWATPFAISWEFEESTVNRLPLYGFCVGVALGLGMGLSTAFRQVVLGVLGFSALGGVLWFLSVILVGGGLILIGVSEDTVDRIMDWVGPAAFLLGISLGGLVVFAWIHDRLDTLLARFRAKQHKKHP